MTTDPFAEPFPAPGGILAFADTDTGDGAFWVTDGDPDQWPIYTDDRGSDVRVTLDLTTLDWLAALARGDDRYSTKVPFSGLPRRSSTRIHSDLRTRLAGWP